MEASVGGVSDLHGVTSQQTVSFCSLATGNVLHPESEFFPSGRTSGNVCKYANVTNVSDFVRFEVLTVML
jgi:hypothetical protein